MDEPLPVPPRIDAIVVGGGPAPDANQVSLEEDVRLAVETFGAERTVVLFAGGAGTRAVQVADLEPRGDPLLARIGALLSPRSGRDAHYRATHLRVHGAATWEQTRAMMELAIAQPGGTLTVYVAGHGDRADVPGETRTLFWGGEAVDAVGLANWLEARSLMRPVRFVVTTCYSGGLGEIAFEAADRSRGPSHQERCGLFATSWDEEASGCDPDPERAHHDGFGVHFLMAMRGLDRDGHDIHSSVDLDHDGRIDPYEALTRARIASRSIDVPTTTSEVFLRGVSEQVESAQAGRAEGRGAPVDLPEQDAVIAALLAEMNLADREALARRLEQTRERKAEHDAALDEAIEVLDARFAAVSAEMLSRWPVLDDPFHPDFAATLARERGAIERYLNTSSTVRAYEEAEGEVDAMESTDLALRLELSLMRRLEQAFETRALAAALAARGGPAWERYLALRRCEKAPW